MSQPSLIVTLLGRACQVLGVFWLVVAVFGAASTLYRAELQLAVPAMNAGLAFLSFRVGTHALRGSVAAAVLAGLVVLAAGLALTLGLIIGRQ